MTRTQGLLAAALVAGLVIWTSDSAQAQFGIGELVFDPTNWIQTSMTAVQTTLTAINTAEIIANQVLDLTGLEAWAVEGTLGPHLQQMYALVLEAQGLAWDVGSLNAQIDALFGLEGAPGTSLEFSLRQQEIRQYLYLSWSYAMRTQTLVRTLLSTVDHILSIYVTLKGIIGNKQGLQSLGQYQAKATQMLAQLDLHTAAMHRAQSVQGINDPLILQSIQHINVGVLGDWALGDTGE
jgi:conjugal transfer/entry exclusion protein